MLPDEHVCEGTLYDQEDQYVLARIRCYLQESTELDGYRQVTGSFVVQEELCPLHTGMAILQLFTGQRWLVRILRLSRPQGDGSLEAIEALPGVGPQNS